MKKSVLFFAFLIALLISCENMAGGGGSDSEPKSPSVPQNPVITVSAPVFSVISGDVSSGTQVSVSCSTDGATIYYTTDGSVPTSASLIYTSPFTINSAIQIKAVGIKTGFADSSISSATYTLEGVIAPPRIDPAGGAVNREQKISLFNFYSYDDVEIFYTTDGSVPDIGSAAYAGTPLSVETSPVNFKAVAIRKSDGLKSVVSAETYKIKVQAPVFSIQGGKVSIGTTVNLSGGNIHYTTDGSEPNSSSPLYSTGIRIDTVTTIKAICISSDSNYANSDVVENTYSPTAFYVCDTGSDSEGTGSVSKPYATLQKAVDVIKSSGTGYEYSVRLMSDVTMPTGLAVNLPQGLNLIIESDSNTMRTIDGNHSDDTCLNFTGSGNLKIKNIKINDYKGAVYASGSGNLIIDHVTARVFRVPSYDGNDGGDGGIAFNLSGGDTKIIYADLNDNPWITTYVGASAKVEIEDMSCVISPRNENDSDGNPTYMYTSAFTICDNSIVTIKNGTYTGHHEELNCGSGWNGTLNVIGGTFESSMWACCSNKSNSPRSRINISGGTFSGHRSDGVSINAGTATITGGKFQNCKGSGISLVGGTTSISNADFYQNGSNGISVYGNAVLSKLENVLIKSNGDHGINYCVSNDSVFTNVRCTDNGADVGVHLGGGNITINGAQSEYSSPHDWTIYSSAKLIIENGTFNTTGGYGIGCFESGNTVVRGGTFNCGIRCHGSSSTNIYNCLANDEVHVLDTGNLTIHGGAYCKGVYANHNGELTIEGGTFKGEIALSESSNGTINGGMFTDRILMNSSKVLTINDCTADYTNGYGNDILMIIDGTTYIKGGKYTNVVSYSSIARICNKGSLYISGGEFKNDCSGGGDLVCFDTYVDDPASGKNLYLSGTLTLTNAAVIALGNKNDRIYLNGDVGNSFRIREMQSSLFATGVQVLYNAGTTDYVSRNFSKFTGNSMDSKNWLVDSTGKLVAN